MGKFTSGTVQSLEEPNDANGNPTFARVVLDADDGIVTRPLSIPFFWRGMFGNIQPGDRVYIGIDDSLNGCIIQRVDGNWDFSIKNEAAAVTITKDLNVSGAVSITGKTTAADIDAAGVKASGNVEAADVKTSAVASINAHTHTGNMGAPTSPPNG